MTYLLEVTIPYMTGIARDVVVNTFHMNFVDHPPTDADFDGVRTALENFYEGIYHTSGFIRFAPWINVDGSTIKIYNLNDPIPRPAVYMNSFVIQNSSPIADSDLPPEVAICLSYQAVQLAGVSQARRRGRIYLGGIGTGVAHGSTTEFPIVNITNRNAIAIAAVGLIAELTTVGWVWVVYSRIGATSAVIHDGWVDDAPDTQRRRGRNSVARTLWDAP